MRHVSFLFIVLSFTIACKGPVVVSNQEFTGPHDRRIPYQEAVHKKNPSKKIAVLLNDNPDTLRLAHSLLVEMLVENEYRVIIPGKPGDDLREQLELDQKDYRVQDVLQLIQTLDSNQQRNLLLIGFGEGGYLLPKIARSARPEFSFIINAGPYSLLTEYEMLLRQPDSNKAILNKLVLKNKLYTVEELAQRVENLKTNETGAPQLSGGSNYYWLSYQRQPLLQDVILIQSPVSWILSEKYPLISKENKIMVEKLAESLPHIKLMELEGKGDFNNKNEMESLTKAIEAVINKPN